MGASLLHLHPLPPLLPRKALAVVPTSRIHLGLHIWNSKAYSRPRTLWFPREGLSKLRYVANNDGLSSDASSTEQVQRSQMIDKPNIDMDGMDDFERQLQELFVEVKNMLKMGNKSDAIDLLQANYEAVKDQMNGGLKGIDQAAILDILALGYMGVGDYDFVEHLLDTLDEIMGGLHDSQPRVDSILLHMGSMYTTLGMFEDAMLVYERGLKILEKEFGSYSQFLITPLMGMAKVYRLIERATKAIMIYHRAIDIMEKSSGTDSEELAIPLVGLGNVLVDEGKAEDAEACFRRILSIYTKVYGENDGRVGMAMCSLAHSLCAKGSVEEAICMYQDGLEVIKESKYVSLDDDVLEKIRVDIAELLHVTGREQEGRQLLQECLLISETFKGVEHPNTVAHLQNLATSYSRSKNFVEAERLLRTCLHIMSKTVDPKDQLITVPMLHLAVVLYHLNRDEEAEHLALEVVQIREDVFGKESLLVGEALDCLVSIQTKLEKDDADVLIKLKRILSIRERELGYESEEVLTTLKKVVFYLDKMGKKDEKVPLQRRLQWLKTKYKQRAPV